MPQIKLPQAQHCELDNGFRYIFYPDHDNKIICLQLIVRIGSAFETDTERGLSHLLEHLSFKSTSSFPDNDLSDYLSSLGISVNAYTDFDSTCYYMLLPSECLGVAVKALAELVRRSQSSAQDLKAEKKIVLEEIRQYDTDPESAFTEYIQNDYFLSSPLRHPIIGTVCGIKAVTHEQVMACKQKYYNPTNCFMVATGAFIPEELRNMVEHEFADWQPSVSSQRMLPPNESLLWPEKNGFKAEKAPISTDLEYVAITLPELSELHPDSEHLLFAMRYLAIGKSSLLHRRLIDKEKLCSSIRVLSVSGLMSGITIILISPLAGASFTRIMQIFKEEFHRALAFQISSKDFELIRSDILHSWLFGFDTMEGFASGLASEELLGSYSQLYHYSERIESITPAEISQRITPIWTFDSLALYYLGNRKGNWNFLKSLKQEFFEELPILPIKRISTKHDNLLEAKPLAPVNSIALSKLNGIGLQDKEVYHFTLKNGLRVVFHRTRGRTLTGFAYSNSLSQLMEGSDNRGINLFTTTAMLYGTKKRNHDRIMDFSRALGMNLRVVHHLDCSSWRGKCFNPDLQKALELLSEIIREPVFHSGYLRTLKHSTIDSIRREKEVPSTYAFNRWFKLLTGNGSNLDRSSGNISQIKQINPQALRAWHQHILNPGDSALAIVGDYDPAELTQIVDSCFSHLQNSGLAPLSPNPVYHSAQRHFLKEKRGSDQAIIHMGVLLPHRQEYLHDTAMQVICHAIGGDIASRFYNILREKHSYTYQAGMDYNSVNDLGFWTAFAFCAPEDHNAVFHLMQEIIGDVCLNGITELELEQSRNYLLGMQRFDYESLSWSAAAIANLRALNYAPDYFFKREQRLKELSPGLLREVAAKWLQPENIYSYIMV